ncbi:hypothetical protein O1L55_13340 [Streptomyces albulus]|nr:hypothetical protein [Streptomyces noursei]
MSQYDEYTTPSQAEGERLDEDRDPSEPRHPRRCAPSRPRRRRAHGGGRHGLTAPARGTHPRRARGL